mgnify:FL=1
MSKTVKLNELRDEIGDIDYPVSRDAASKETSGVTLQYADGEEPLADVIRRSNETEFGSVDDLEAEVYSNLPTEAVGEPGQSEGEG